MKAIHFPEANKIWAQDQEEYQPLPSFGDDKVNVSCFELSLKERLKLLFTGKLWFCQYNFNRELQPILPTVSKPFSK